jgi:hypothetical protein
LPTVGDVQGGFSPLLEVYGKGKNRFPILVQFNYPLSWVVTLPSNDVNGEDGTVQAGDYAKGDTATFFVYEEPGNIKVNTASVGLTSMQLFLAPRSPMGAFGTSSTQTLSPTHCIFPYPLISKMFRLYLGHC